MLVGYYYACHLNMLYYASLINKEGINMRKKSEGALAGNVPSLWLEGYVTIAMEFCMAFPHFWKELIHPKT
jgi:hypothetical protein